MAADQSSSLKRSQFGDLDDGVMSQDKWEERWAKGQTRFHMPRVHPRLQKHLQLLTQGSRGSRFFLPLCGKSLDMKWLAGEDYDVCGCEFVEQGCREFFEENGIEYTTESFPGNIEGKVFKSGVPDVKVTLYCCDFFQLTKDVVGELDCIWDRGSLAAINASERKQYTQKMVTLLSPQTRYLAEVFQLDNTHFSGPPHNFPEEELRGYFETSCNIQQVDEVDALTDWQREWGLDSFVACDYLLTLKTT